MAQYARPDSDITVGGWTTEPLYASVDESSANDTDYIARQGADGTCVLGLSSVSDPNVHTDHVLRVRSRKIGAGVINSLTATLYCGATSIASTACSLTTSFVTTELTLSEAQAQAITDYADLRVQLASDWVSGSLTGAYVSWVELEVPEVSPGVDGSVTATKATSTGSAGAAGVGGGAGAAVCAADAAAPVPGVAGTKSIVTATLATAAAAAMAATPAGVRSPTVTGELATAAAAAPEPGVTGTTSEVKATTATAAAAGVAPEATGTRDGAVTAVAAIAAAVMAAAADVFGTVPRLVPESPIGGWFGRLLAAAPMGGAFGLELAAAPMGGAFGLELAAAPIGGTAAREFAEAVSRG